jgi:hypothetical protein
MTPEELAEIKARVEAATDAPWVYDDEYGNVQCIVDNEYFDEHDKDVLGSGCELPGHSDLCANGTFIAASRTDVPALVAEVERLQGQVTMLREMLTNVEWAYPEDSAEEPFCPMCGNYQDDGHEADCKLVSAMRSTEPPQGGDRQ